MAKRVLLIWCQRDFLYIIKRQIFGDINCMRQSLSPCDKICLHLDQFVKTMLPSQNSERCYPAEKMNEPDLNKNERWHAAGLMRVNHSGEVSAQALYQGQSLTAKLPHVRQQMQQAAIEEMDHLAWCERRLNELDSRASLLNPLWYTNALLLGAIAGWLGDRWSLGFVAETERQVTEHLDKHLQKLPSSDYKSQAILDQMRLEEQQHQQTAIDAGAANFPASMQMLMRIMAKMMTTTTYWI